MAQTLAEGNKDWKAALVPYRELTAAFPNNALFSFHLAQTYQRAGCLQDSLDAYRRVISSLHLQPPATYLLCRSRFSAGQILEGQERYKEAIEEYKNALALADIDDKATAWFVPWSHLQIGKCLERAGHRELALVQLASVKKEEDRDAYRRAQRLEADIRARSATTGR